MVYSFKLFKIMKVNENLFNTYSWFLNEEGNDLFPPILMLEEVDLQGLGDGNGGLDLCTGRLSNGVSDEYSWLSLSLSLFSLLLRRSVPEKSLSGILISLASFNLITSLQGSWSRGKTSFKHISEMTFPSTSSSWSLTYYGIFQYTSFQKIMQ